MSVKSMPVGYRFHPTDQELVNYYLKLKNQGSDRHVSNIRQIDVCKWEPWDLPGHLGSESDDQEWYFFGQRDSKYSKSKSTRSNRATKDGYWKPTGKDRYIKTGSKKVIGTKKTLVYYKGRSQKAVRTNWVMHEYRASAYIHNPQAFVLYLLKKKSDDDPEIPIPDGIDPITSSPSASLLNTVPCNTPPTPTVHQGSANFSSTDQSHLNQNLKEQEVSSYSQNYIFDSAYLDEDIYQHLQAFERCFEGQPPTFAGLDEILPAIPSADVYTNQGPIHMTAKYLNVSNNDSGVTQFQNLRRQEEFINRSRFMPAAETVPLDSESSTETDNDVPKSLFGEDALHGESAYLSDSGSLNSEFYNDMILAHEVSLSTSSDIIQHVEMEEDKKVPKKPTSSEGVRGSAINNPRTRNYSEVSAQASVSDDSSGEFLYEAKSSRIPEAAGNKSSGAIGLLGRNCHNTGFIVYEENPRMKNGTIPPSNYIVNIAIGIFLTVVITGEVLFGLVS